MKHKILTLLFTLSTVICYGQNQNENVLYVIDSVPITKNPKEGLGSLTKDAIDRIEVLKDKETIEKVGYKDLDGIIYIFTKEYVKRPDSIKAIPTSKTMIKKNSTWYLKNSSIPYSGKFVDYYLTGKKQGEGTLFNGKLKGQRLIYYLNGNVSDAIEYDNGIANGTEKRFYQDGVLKQKGNFKNGKEVGVWEVYHPNGQLKQHINFVYGKMDGAVISYYSTGKIKSKTSYKNGIYQKDKINNKIYTYYQQAQDLYKQGQFKSAIKKYTKCIELRENWADGYFARGNAKLNSFEFDEAIKDFDKALEIEPYFTQAYSNRAFTIIRKYEFGNKRTLSKSDNIQVIASNEAKIPVEELVKVCADLKKAVSLGDTNWMVLEALKKHCKE